MRNTKLTKRRGALIASVSLLGCAVLAAPALANTDYSKFRISDADIAAYKSTNITACQQVQAQNRDFMKPPANIPTLKHFVRLYAACQRSLESAHAPRGVLRVNDVGFGATCIALGVLDTTENLIPECNMKSYL